MLKFQLNTTADQMWECFGAFQDVSDSAGCVATFDRIAPLIYPTIEGVQTELPSIISAFMPKSGGTFLHNRFVKSVGYKEFHWGITLKKDPIGVFVSEKALELFLRGGCTSHTHMVPHPYNIDVFNRLGVERIWIHLRDPRDAAMAAYYHYLGQGQGEGEIAASRIEGIRQQADLLGLRLNTGQQDEIDEFVMRSLPFMIDWIERWLSFGAANPYSLIITYHKHLVDTEGLIRHLLAQFGYIPPDSFNIVDYLPEDRRRFAERRDWREFVSANVAALGDEMVESRLSRYSVWHDLCAPGLEFPSFAQPSAGIENAGVNGGMNCDDAPNQNGTDVGPNLSDAANRASIADVTHNSAEPLGDPISPNQGAPMSEHPDFDPDFMEIYERCKTATMTSIERMYALYKAVEYIVDADIPGDFVECGVWRGGSVMLMAATLVAKGKTDRRIFLYDTFSGMAPPTAADLDYAGQSADHLLAATQNQKEELIWCLAPLDEVKKNLATIEYPFQQYVFVEGKVEETIPGTVPSSASLLRLDTDWYESTRHELEHLYPILSHSGVMIIDDYGHWRGSRQAVDEYFDGPRKILLNRIDYTGRIAVKP